MNLIEYPGLIVGSERETKLKRFLEENRFPSLLNIEDEVLIVDPDRVTLEVGCRHYRGSGERKLSMKKTKTCPKCGSVKVIEVGYHRGGGSGYGGCIQLREFSKDYARPVRFLCCGCGYFEDWVPEKYLDMIFERYATQEERQRADEYDRANRVRDF